MTHDELPAWDVLDRHVLRFYAHGKETVPDTNLENWRSNAFTILYYLQDDTVQVSNNIPDNSGCGVFSALGGQGDKGLSSNMLKRARLKRWRGEGFVSPDDFQMGEDFQFLGRRVKISGCDAFTTQYYESIGKPLVGCCWTESC